MLVGRRSLAASAPTGPQLKQSSDLPIDHLTRRILNSTNLQDLPTQALNERLRRQKRLLEIVNRGLPPFPHTALELTAILSGPSADIKKAAKLIRTDPHLSVSVLRMCNSPLFGLRSRVISIEQAATLLGSERLRTLTMTSSMADFAGPGLPEEQAASFWKHNLLAAMLSEYLAKRTEYSEKEQAYIAGLIHDIGQVPHWMLACEEKAQEKTAPPENWSDDVSAESDYFGLDHCDVGSRMASNWNFMPSFIDVLTNHHCPDRAHHDPYLVKIVGAVEHFLLTRVDAEPPQDTIPDPLSASPAPEIAPPRVIKKSSQPYGDSEWRDIARDMEKEYNRLLPFVEGGVTSVLAGAS